MTTFGTLARLPAEVRDADVAMLVVDEAHFVENPDAARSQAVAAAVGRAQRALFLTGTPMENRLTQWRALMRSAAPLRRSTCAAIRSTSPPSFPRRSKSRRGCSSATPTSVRIAQRWSNLQAMRQAAFSTGSAKLERLREIVEEAAQDGMKVLVFSYFLGALDTCAREFRVVARSPGRCRIDGPGVGLLRLAS